MLRHVIERELKDCIYGYRSVLVFVLSAVLFVVGIYTGAREYQAELQEYRLAQVALRQSLAEESSLYALSTFVFNFVKPPAVLGILVSGAELHTSRVYNLRLYTLPTPQGSANSENPNVAVFGALDLSFIVQVVLGLTALLFTFSTICGEKEAGTLKLQLANALPKDALLLGKLLGNLAGLLIPVAVAFLLACLTLVNFTDISPGSDVGVRILFLGVDFFLYLTVFFALGMCVSTVTTRTTTAFGLCLAGWVLLVAIVPKFAVIMARQLSPLEPLQEFEMKKAEVDRRGSLEVQEEAQKYMQAHDGHAPTTGVYEDVMTRVREEQNRELTKLEEDYVQRKERQARVALMVSRLSPAGSASYSAMSLAGTELERDLRFRVALRNYRSEFTSYYDRKSRELLAMTPNVQTSPVTFKYRFTDLPPFEFPEERLAASLNSALPDMGLLVVWALVFFVAAYFKFLRYDVR